MVMIERFKGPDGQRRVIEVLRSQTILDGDLQCATSVAESAEILGLEAKEILIDQEASDTDLYFVLAGKLSIYVNGRKVATRSVGAHVGEMSLVDISKPRSATVVAESDAVVAKVDEPTFTKLANDYPRLWRNIALEMGDRLRQRNGLVEPLNSHPILFIGCATGSLNIGREIRSQFSHDKITVRLWSDGVFGASNFTIEDLERQVSEADFAALLLTSDDVVRSRGKQTDAPRDNVVFELGMFMGGLGRKRTFIVRPRSIDLKLPSDLLGITAITYDHQPASEISANLGPACDELRKIVTTVGPR